MRKLLTIALLFTSSAAFPHSFYDAVCCSDKDCKPIPVGEVKATPAGWQIVLTGEVLEYGSWRIKDSPDGKFHRCAMNADFTPKGRTLCLYVPPTGA